MISNFPEGLFVVIFTFVYIKSHLKTPLHWAAREGYIECVLLLLDAGADVTAKTVSFYGKIRIESLTE